MRNGEMASDFPHLPDYARTSALDIDNGPDGAIVIKGYRNRGGVGNAARP
jgi:hypothetical protein